MKRPAIFFDRDNTLIIGTEYLGDPEKVVLMPGAANAVARARELGYATVVVSNQSGVARGMFDELAVRAVNERMDEMLRAENPGAVIDRHEYCPFHPDASVAAYRKESELRKPKPGMLLRSAERIGLDLQKSWMIGDAPRDIEAGAAAGCRNILLKDEAIPASPAALATTVVEPEKTVTTLGQALDYIEAEGEKEPSQLPSVAPIFKEEIAPAVTTEEVAPDDTDETESAPIPPQDAAAEAADGVPKPTEIPEPIINQTQPTPGKSASDTVLDRMARIERAIEKLVDETKRSHEHAPSDFSVSKLVAGIMQIIALATVFLAYLNMNSVNFLPALVFACFLQAFTIALLIMSKQT